MGGPYIDLHRHLEGSVTPFVAKKIGMPLDSLWKGDVDFFAFWPPIIAYFDSPERYEEVAYYSLEELHKKGTIYVELIVAPAPSELDPYNIVQAAKRGVDRAFEDFGIRAGIIYSLIRHFPGKLSSDLRVAYELFDDGIINGIGLAGDEENFPLKDIRRYFENDLRADVPRSFHAGEFSGPGEIEEAIELGAVRIGHGNHLSEDPDLLRRVKDEQIGIEVCIVSELKLNNVSSLEEHPVFLFNKEDLLFNVNTDDPAVFGVEIDDEYELFEPKVNAQTINKNAITMAFCSEEIKKELRTYIGQ